MADRIAVATKRAIAETRLAQAVERASKSFGVTFTPPAVPRSRFPDLYAAQLIECVAEFVEKITAEYGGPTGEQNERPDNRKEHAPALA